MTGPGPSDIIRYHLDVSLGQSPQANQTHFSLTTHYVGLGSGFLVDVNICELWSETQCHL